MNNSAHYSGIKFYSFEDREPLVFSLENGLQWLDKVLSKHPYMLQGAKPTINALRPRPNRRHFADDIFKPIFLNETVRILINISVKFVPRGQINNIPTLVQIMAWCKTGDKPLFEPMMTQFNDAYMRHSASVS